MYERFTDAARRVMQQALQESRKWNHEYLGTEHILLALLQEGPCEAVHILNNMRIDMHAIRTQIEKLFPAPSAVVKPKSRNWLAAAWQGLTAPKLPQTPRAKHVIEKSIEEARDRNHKFVGTEYLLLGLLRDPESTGGCILRMWGVNLDEVRQQVIQRASASCESES